MEPQFIMQKFRFPKVSILFQQVTDQYEQQEKDKGRLERIYLKDVPFTPAQNENNTKPTLGGHPLTSQQAQGWQVLLLN